MVHALGQIIEKLGIMQIVFAREREERGGGGGGVEERREKRVGMK